VKNLAPDIFRQRLLIEGYYTIDVSADTIARFLLGVAEHLNLRTYGGPAIHSPGGKGREVNQGFDAFIPLVDSGISLYVWSSARFFSAIIYSCKAFDALRAVAFAESFFTPKDQLFHKSF
jgi:S-adenosylmethionine decarboxylase